MDILNFDSSKNISQLTHPISLTLLFLYIFQDFTYLTTFILGSYFSSLTPITNMGASAEGAEMMTFFAPPLRCAPAFSMVVNTPVDSTTVSAPCFPHGMVVGSLLAYTSTVLPLMTSFPSTTLTSPLNLPWVESYLNR